MSRVGKNVIKIPSDVQVSILDTCVEVKGKKGQMKLDVDFSKVSVEKDDNVLTVKLVGDNIVFASLWGTVRNILNNMIVGVSEGFVKKIVMQGVGYRAAVQGKNLVMQLGYSHEIVFPIPENVTVTCPDPTHVDVAGFSKEQVGQVAAKIRSFRKPEPYKGKGVMYVGEKILRKEGKKK